MVYRPGPSFLAGRPLAEQPLKEHFQYMVSLHAKASMKLAGPFPDNSGGAVVLEVENDAEAKAIVANDPAVLSRVFDYALHPWAPVSWEKYVKKP